MPAFKHLTIRPNISSWISAATWHERVITFNPSWFTLTMGTGVIVQLLNNFPWPAVWLQNCGYAFWVLDLILFVFFTGMGCARLAMYPKVALAILDDFSQTAYLGAIPVSFDSVATGLVLYHHHYLTATYAAEALFWISVILSVAVGLGGVFAMYKHQGQHTLDEVTGTWLLTFVPLIVTALLGACLTPYLARPNKGTVFVVSWLLLSLGLGLSFVVITIYFWRLMACSLPANDAIVSCFVPVGPLSNGAHAVLALSLDLSRFVTLYHFTFEEDWTTSNDQINYATIAQIFIWMGVIISLTLLGIATFFMAEAIASVFSRIPKTFNIGFWSFVFPCGSYAAALCRLGDQLRNDGMKGWAAIWVVGTILVWLLCAVMTVYKGVWQGKTFIAPGLQGFVEEQVLEELRRQALNESTDDVVAAATEVNMQQLKASSETVVSTDGTYDKTDLLKPGESAQKV